MARVLLTGATGLIGRAATKALATAGHEVIALSRRGKAEGSHRGIACNLLVPWEVSTAVQEAQATHLLHLAWHDDPGDRWTSPANLDWMAATLHLVRTFARSGGKRAVCAGSCAEYDWSEAMLTETTPLRPRTIYGAAKAGTGLALCAAGPELGLSFAWARVFFVFGPGEPRGRLLGDLIRNLKAGTIANCTDGLQQRDFLHVDDLGRALTMILESDVTGAVNVASGKSVPVRDLIEEVARQLGRHDLVRLGARPRPENDPERLAADITRLRNEVGFEPRHDIVSGIISILSDEARGF